MQRTSERQVSCLNGIIGLAVSLVLLGFAIASISQGQLGTGVVGLLLAIVSLSGLCQIEPNQAKVITLFGNYLGTLRVCGLWWTIPFTGKRAVSLRVANFISEKLKVNDADGNPIEIAAVIVWQVTAPERAVLDVENYLDFVKIQAETALRGIASEFPYDLFDRRGTSLRSSTREVGAALRRELATHLAAAGIDVLDAQISHLAYAQEIAQTMLRRQQAQAVLAARMQIVEGAVGMVEQALEQLAKRNIVTLDNERKSQLVAQLLVTLVSESSVQPVITTSTIS